MRLIDADAIEKFIEDGLNNPDKLNAFGHDAIEIMAEVHYAPTIDAVPVVRCKDCKYREKETSNENYLCNRKMLGLVRPDDFCSYGEKRCGDAT